MSQKVSVYSTQKMTFLDGCTQFCTQVAENWGMVGVLMKNYYEILEVTPEASEEVIKAAYKALVKRMHPDNGKQCPFR